MAFEIPAAKQAEFDRFKVEGFKNPDGSSFDPDTLIYTRGEKDTTTPHSLKVGSIEEAFGYKAKDAVAYKEAAKEAAKEKTEEKKADVKVEAAGAKIELKTAVGLDVLQNQMKDKFADLTEAMKVELRDSPALKAAFPLDKSFDGAALVAKASGNVKTELLSLFSDTAKRGQFTKLVAYLKPYFQSEGKDVSEDDVSKLLADLYSISAGASLKKQFDGMRLTDFAKTVGDTSYAMNYDISFDKTNLVTKVASDATFDQAFKEFNTKNPKVVDPKEKAKDDARLDRARKFRNTLPGRFLAMSGILTLEEPIEGEDAAGKAAREARNDASYASILKGDNFIAKWVIVLCGGSAMLEGGAADIEESIANMDPKYKGIITKFQAVAGNSPLSLKKTAEQLAAPVEEILALDDVQFKKALAEKTLPATFKLKEAYKAGDKGTRIVLGEGAEMILKKGTKIRAGEKEVVAEEADKSFKETVVVKYDIPAGTVFKGKVQFVPEVAAAKPAPDAKEKTAS